jgi:hypothetical protein
MCGGWTVSVPSERWQKGKSRALRNVPVAHRWPDIHGVPPRPIEPLN